MRMFRITPLVLLLVLTIFGMAIAEMSIEERIAARNAILAQEPGANAIRAPLPVINDAEDYCSSCYTDPDEYITNVTFNTIENNTGMEGPPCAYGDYTEISTDILMGETYNLSVTFNSGIWTEQVRAWIDWNQDEVFDADESYFLGSGVNATVSTDIAVPLDAGIGLNRMRIIMQFSSDPGPDGACDGQGGHSDYFGETEDYSVNTMPLGDPGFLTGIVTDLQMNPIEGAEVTVAGDSYTTGVDGIYEFELYPMTYSATATAQYHFPLTIDDIVVVEHETTIVDFALPTPMIDVNTDEINVQMDSGDVVVIPRTISNTGDGELQFSVSLGIGDGIFNVIPGIRPATQIERSRSDDELPLGNTAEYSPTFRPGNLPTILDFGDELFRFDAETQTGDIRILGIEFDGVYFWLTGGNDLVTHYLHKFDRDGNYIESYNQGTTSQWGWRDLAWDGQYLYASDENELAVIDPATGQKVGELPMPNVFSPPLRALAYDAATDHFWSANWATVIIEFDRTGAVINSYANTLSIYGMAWDDVSDGGPYLWTYSQDGTPGTMISQFDPATGEYTGVSFFAIDNSGNDALAGGICFTTDWDASVGVLGCVLQDDPDMVAGYEVTPAVQWLSVDPMSGVLQPSENMDINITLDFTDPGLNYDSTYAANLVIHNNSSVTPEIPILVNGEVGVEDDITGLPREFSVSQNYPNPFNAQTNISFSLPRQSDVTIEVYNLLGQKTATIAEGLMPAGHHTVTWDASDVASGIYYYKISAGEYSAVKMMTLLK